MGRVKANKPRPQVIRKTTEPPVPLPGWPESHVGAELTGDDDFECVRVTVHGVEHLLHASTARELWVMLGGVMREYNAVAEKEGFPGV